VPGSLKAVRVLVIDANIFMISLDSFIQDLRAALDSNFENFEFIDVDPQLEKPASVVRYLRGIATWSILTQHLFKDAKTHSTIASVLSSLVKTILETVDSKASEVCITLNLNCGMHTNTSIFSCFKIPSINHYRKSNHHSRWSHIEILCSLFLWICYQSWKHGVAKR